MNEIIWDDKKNKEKIESLEYQIAKLEEENDRLGRILSKAFDSAINKTAVFLDPETTNEICVFEKIMEDGLK